MTAWLAHAALVFFYWCRTMSITGLGMEGNLRLLLLRSGGEIACDPSMSARIAPDEVFFFSSRRRHTSLTCDWSSDVCSSDLRVGGKRIDLPRSRCRQPIDAGLD